MEEALTEHKAYHALNIVTGANYRILEDLSQRWGRWQDALKKAPPHSAIDPGKEWEKLTKLRIALVLREEPGYPPLLKEIPYPPLGIYILGNTSFDGPAIAIVGTRKATEEGKETAGFFGASLGAAGLTVVSGLAFGIDAKAHEGALDSRGKTIATLAHGLERIYPKTNEALGRRILREGGAFLSEYPVGSPTLPYRFLERNRIISGLSRGVLVIEAPRGSGALTTARFALEQNREVFVVPGPIRHQNFSGSHELLKSGATLVTEPRDILECLGIASATTSNPRSNEEQLLFSVLASSHAPLQVDKIIELTNLNAQTVNQLLSLLLIQGDVRENNEGYFV